MTRQITWIASLALAGACGETASVSSTCEPDCRTAEVSLCGTEASVGFIGIGGLHPDAGSGGPTSILGADVLVEIGSPYVAIGKSCEFWSYDAVGPRGEPGGVVYTGHLSPNQASEISAMLKLDTWEALGPVHGRCCVFDFAPSSYHWGSNTLAWVGTPNAAGPPPLPADFPLDLSRLHFELAEVLSELGAPTQGPIRYSAIFAPWLRDQLAENAPAWPLETPIAELAVTEDEAFELQAQGLPPPIHRAEGDDADRLRAIRTAAQNGEFGFLENTGFIPIREPDGSTYILYQRDVGSFESPEGVPARDPVAL